MEDVVIKCTDRIHFAEFTFYLCAQYIIIVLFNYYILPLSVLKSCAHAHTTLQVLLITMSLIYKHISVVAKLQLHYYEHIHCRVHIQCW